MVFTRLAIQCNGFIYDYRGLVASLVNQTLTTSVALDVLHLESVCWWHSTVHSVLAIAHWENVVLTIILFGWLFHRQPDCNRWQWRIPSYSGSTKAILLNITHKLVYDSFLHRNGTNRCCCSSMEISNRYAGPYSATIHVFCTVIIAGAMSPSPATKVGPKDSNQESTGTQVPSPNPNVNLNKGNNYVCT